LDIRHKFVISWLYELPNVSTDRSFLKILAHGWQWSGSYIAESGQPVTPLSDNDANANGDGAGDRAIINPHGIGLTGTAVNFVVMTVWWRNPHHHPDQVPASGVIPCGSGNDANIVGYLAADSSARYVQAGTGAFANAGRNILSTPGLNIWNMSIFKATKITERFTLQFRADTYNTFNHRNFSIGLPSNNGALESDDQSESVCCCLRQRGCRK